MYPQRWIAPAVLILIWGLWGLLDLGNQPTGGFGWGDSIILSVESGGPAEKAGLREGDRILTMDGISPSDLQDLQRRPRTEIGETQVLVVERSSPVTGETTTETIEITYTGIPAAEWTLDSVGAVIGLAFLLTGMGVFLKVQTTASLLFAIVGFGFAGTLMPDPYIGPFGLRAFTATLFFLVFLTSFAALLHLLLIFPKRKRVMERKNIGKLLYLPVVITGLLGVLNFYGRLPDSFPGALFIGLVFIGYLVLSMGALIHSFVTAAPEERAEEGLNLMLVGVVVGLAPLVLLMVAGMFFRTDLIPGSGYLFLTLALIPISFGLALLKSERGGHGPEAAQPA